MWTSRLRVPDTVNPPWQWGNDCTQPSQHKPQGRAPFLRVNQTAFCFKKLLWKSLSPSLWDLVSFQNALTWHLALFWVKQILLSAQVSLRAWVLSILPSLFLSLPLFLSLSFSFVSHSTIYVSWSSFSPKFSLSSFLFCLRTSLSLVTPLLTNSWSYRKTAYFASSPLICLPISHIPCLLSVVFLLVLCYWAFLSLADSPPLRCLSSHKHSFLPNVSTQTHAFVTSE